MFLTSDSSFANDTSSRCVKTGGISIWQWLTQRRRSRALVLGFREIRRSLEFWGLTYHQCRLDNLASDSVILSLFTWSWHELMTFKQWQVPSEFEVDVSQPLCVTFEQIQEEAHLHLICIFDIQYSRGMIKITEAKMQLFWFENSVALFIVLFLRLQTMPSLELKKSVKTGH